MLPCITENCEMKNCADCVIENAKREEGYPKGDLGGGGTLGRTRVGRGGVYILPHTFLKQVHNRYNKMGIREKEKGDGGGVGRGKETFCVKLYERGREREKR
jgi:hypothetical protein